MGVLGYDFAPRTTAVAESQTDSQVVSGASIYVHGFICSATSSGPATVRFENAAGTLLHVVELLASTSFESHAKWYAPNGLQVTTSAGASCLVFHSQPGA